MVCKDKESISWTSLLSDRKVPTYGPGRHHKSPKLEIWASAFEMYFKDFLSRNCYNVNRNTSKEYNLYSEIFEAMLFALTKIRKYSVCD